MSKQIDREAIYDWIIQRCPVGGRVLDIGCGRGELLGLLAAERQAKGVGIEINEECITHAVQRGLSVHHGDVEEGLDHYSDAAFDLVIIAETIQELSDLERVLREAFRVGKQVVIVFPNFGYWRARWQLALGGRAPHTRSLPYQWYNSPNRHFFTIADWEEYVTAEKLETVDRICIVRGKPVRCLGNLRAEIAGYLMRGKSEGTP